MTAAARVHDRNGVRASRRGEWRVLAAAVALVLAAHAWLLAGWPPGAGDRPRAGGLQPIQVRQIGRPVAEPGDGSGEGRVAGNAEALAEARSEVRAVAPAARRVAPSVRLGANKPADPAAPATPAATPSAAPATTPLATALVTPATTPAADIPADIAAATPQSPAGAMPIPRPGRRPEPMPAGGAPAPIYPTTRPAAATLRYAMRRGAASGMAALDWRPAGEHYELTLAGSIGGVEAIGWRSRGGFDDAGVAPERFVVRQRGRERLAANFQRDSADAASTRGRITFSGPSVEWPLPAGAQDRVSWIVQLAAILQARPELAREGAQVSLWVIGARGDADLWTFEAHADAMERDETTSGAAGRAAAGVRLVREPARPYDLRVEVWPDAAHQQLPKRLRFVVDPGGQTTEFELQPPQPAR
jgi:hypothetical protein